MGNCDSRHVCNQLVLQGTVHTFKSCTSRPNVCQCLVVKTPWITCQNNKPFTSITYVACELKLRLVTVKSGTRGRIHAQETGSCIMPGLARINCRNKIPSLTCSLLIWIPSRVMPMPVKRTASQAELWLAIHRTFSGIETHNRLCKLMIYIHMNTQHIQQHTKHLESRLEDL